jgi:hypothetical protein
MHRLKSSWKLAAMFAIGAFASLLYVSHSKAFTLIEFQYLPAVQLNASQGAAIKISNVSTAALLVDISIFTDGGRTFASSSVTIPAGETHTVNFKNPAKGPAGFRAALAFGAASSAVADMMLFDTNGNVTALVPAVQLTAP